MRVISWKIYEMMNNRDIPLYTNDLINGAYYLIILFIDIYLDL